MAILVFADGASSGNPGPGGWGAIIRDESQQIRELAGGHLHTTNNRMELVAVQSALSTIRQKNLPGSPIEIYTDSSYVIQGITEWIHGWRKRGWKTAGGTEVLNRDLWEALADECQALASRDLRWKYVPGHAGIPANERVDALAVQQSQGITSDLYTGPASSYEIDLNDLTPRPHLLAAKAAKKRPIPSQGSAYYLSLVGGTVARHITWAECEARVKGVSGARYKKVSTNEEEKETLSSWGVARG